jgi:hypothetical protein
MSMNCHICDQLAAEMGELLLKQKTAADALEEGTGSADEVDRIDTDLRAARQKLIDHLRLIHGSA